MLCNKKRGRQLQLCWAQGCRLADQRLGKDKDHRMVAWLSLEVRWVSTHTTDKEKAKMSPEDMQIAMRMRERMSSPRSEQSLMERSMLNWRRKMRLGSAKKHMRPFGMWRPFIVTLKISKDKNYQGPPTVADARPIDVATKDRRPKVLLDHPAIPQCCRATWPHNVLRRRQ